MYGKETFNTDRDQGAVQADRPGKPYGRPDAVDGNGNHLQLCDHAQGGIQGAENLQDREQGK